MNLKSQAARLRRALLALALGLGAAPGTYAVANLDVGNGFDAEDGTYLNARNVADTLFFTIVTLEVANQIRFVENVDLANSFFGTSQFDLKLETQTIDVNGNVVLGAGTLHLNAPTVNLDGVVSRSIPSSSPLLQSNASMVNVKANGLIDQGLAIAAPNNAYVTVSGAHADAITFAAQNPLLLIGADVHMTAGSLESVQLGAGSTFNWKGGQLLSNVGYDLFSFAGGVVNVFGSAFALNGTPVAPAALFSLSNAAGQLSGVLADGSAFSVDYLSDGTLNLISAVPEPETYALMLAGLGAVAWAARRKPKARAEPTTA